MDLLSTVMEDQRTSTPDPLYFVDERGRVGRERPDGLCDYAYGVGLRPRGAATYFERALDGERAMSWQQREMWARVQEVSDARVVERVAKRLRLRDRDLVADVGLAALCYAAVTWVEGRSTLERYSRQVVECALQKRRGSQARDRERQLLQDRDSLAAADASVERGLHASDELLSLGLTEQEIDLLYLRFDSGLSLEELAARMGASSRSTAKKHIDRIVDKCRQSRNDSESC